MNTPVELDQVAVSHAVDALRSALAAARAHAAGTDLAGEIAGLAEARLVVSAEGERVLVELFALNSEGEVMRVFALDCEQEVMQ